MRMLRMENSYSSSNLKVANRGKVSVMSLERSIRPALMSGFGSMKRQGVFLLPPGWDASPSQGYPFIHLGGERHRESKVS